MSESDTGPVTVPRQVHCELTTMRQMGTHDMLSEDVLDGLETYNFDAARQWVLEHPDEYVRSLEQGMRDETLVGASSE
ncbi:hypothetical protein SAMN04488063_2651 [Halopelagius inordinatus]|uniref:Uncharacterized protein n=1 Tax=Halopelagius inordinatus TaxID=553467 RepID=A0A1I2TDN0_9EURY|nr:hypothetical protein [Halopelagius inordinatus]SFG63084.1 hypothetical protein SAMN04488063_2651 [Halopelagius inordinatus]